MSSTKLTVQPQTPFSIKIKKAWKGFMEAGTEDRSKELVPKQYLDIATDSRYTITLITLQLYSPLV